MSEVNSSNDDHLSDLHRFQLLVSAIHDYAIYMLDVDGRVVSWNAGAQRFKGYSEAEIRGQHFSRFYTAEDRAAALPERALKAAAEHGKFEVEGWRVRKDGSRFWASAVIDPIRAEDGRLLGFARITRDISERKAAADALQRSEQEFRLLVQGVKDYAIYMLDPQGRVTNWNAGARRITGYEKEEVLGQHFSLFYTPEDRASGLPDEALQTAATQGRFEHEGWRLRKDGSRFIASALLEPIADPDGKLIGYAKITRDITEKQEAAAALKKAELALLQAQKMEAIGKLTGGVAHDFNNLLQVIAGNLQLLSRDIAGNERAERRVQGALAGIRRGAKLASQLLAFGRRQPLEPKVVNLGRLLGATTDLYRRTLGEAVEVETVIAGGLWNTSVDVVQVENALLNLAINARDAMNGVGKLTIEVGNAFLDEAYARVNADVVAGQYVLIAVSDTGAGMTPEIMAQAFEPFFSTKPEGQGTGLGLSMVYGFVKQSNGHVKIYSEVGHGTTVKLYLPRSQEAEDLPAPADARVVSGGTETVLVAEDDEEVCATVLETLTELGYQVLKAHDGESALAIIQSGIKIDLLFTDVVMPGPLRSPDLARKARERLPDIAVLFTSGYTQNAIVHGGRLDPGVDLLTKPYSREDLARKVRQVIEKQARNKKTGP
ncbi:Blue-light-activated protein [Variovorax sp. PBS-H4]|uniref:hybrid sensor histidine kinase/response regulator n=1 Tax=Variovorax sp. PBS-H4 TaxID=434008 RepID=UPI001317D1A7|nr:PAS domain-containing sensor histidine kinase [Variovorax sp. PBS-H4]VTU28751.1 Blue-light-activated protein [Variovorax sp. PBS-H4]